MPKASASGTRAAETKTRNRVSRTSTTSAKTPVATKTRARAGSSETKSATHSVKALAAQASARAKSERAREARALLDAIGRKIAAAEESFYEIGASLVRLRDPAMFGAAGFDTFEALLASIPKLSREVGYRCMRIATSYDEATALTLSQGKALALLTYVEATPEPDDAEALARADAKVGGLPISQQTAEGILRAATEARPEAKRRVREGEKEAKEAATQLEKRLRKAIGGAVDVRVALRKKAWRLLVDVPAEAAPRISILKRKGA